MLHFAKPPIFRIDKKPKMPIMTENNNNNESQSSSNKRRSPWTIQEDQIIQVLVSKIGTKNWTLLAGKMKEDFNIPGRTGKQCRERWHNHLDPKIKTEDWSEKEEAMLFIKHQEIGNKWSEIAKSLPGRTDNSIKNHFYSKLRKYIRKIVKILHKENMFEENNIDQDYYNSERIYKIIKRQKIPYNQLSKDSIIDLIFKHSISSREESKQFKKKKWRISTGNKFCREKEPTEGIKIISDPAINNNTDEQTKQFIHQASSELFSTILKAEHNYFSSDFSSKKQTTQEFDNRRMLTRPFIEYNPYNSEYFSNRNSNIEHTTEKNNETNTNINILEPQPQDRLSLDYTSTLTSLYRLNGMQMNGMNSISNQLLLNEMIYNNIMKQAYSIPKDATTFTQAFNDNNEQNIKKI